MPYFCVILDSFRHDPSSAAKTDFLFQGGMSMLQIQKLSIYHKKDLRTILNDFTFSLNPGDKAVLIGEEGNGKSTLLRWLYDPQSVEEYAEVTGSRILSGETLGYLPQELPDCDKEKSIYEYFCQCEQFFDLTPKELGQLAAQLHLPTDFFYEDQCMSSLSGGEKVKTQLARLLMAQPTILLLDEPSNDLDLETLRWLEQFIRDCPQSVLFISHDEILISRCANVVIHLEQLRRKTVSRSTVFRGNYEDYIRQRNAAFQNQEREALNDQRQEKIREEKFQRLYQQVEHAQATVSRQDPHGGQLLKKKMKAVKSMEKRFEREHEAMRQLPEEEEAIFLRFGEDISIPNGKIMIDYSLSELKTADKERILARNIQLLVKGQQKVCIIGRNGCGKTTLLKQLAEELLQRSDIRAAYMPQNYEDLLELEQTPVDFLAPGGSKEDITRARTFLGSMKYTTQEMEHPIRELSGGQKAKVLLLKMSFSDADVLILDEPTRNFSPLSAPVIRDVLKHYGGVIISISHDRKYISEVCDCVYRLTEQGLLKLEHFEA